MPQAEGEPIYCFSLVTRISVKQGNIYGFQDRTTKNYMMCKNGPLKQPYKMKATRYYILCDCQSNSKRIFAKFDENTLTFSKNRKKILEISQLNSKFFSLITNNIYGKFHKKPNRFQETEINTIRQTKKYSKMASMKEGLVKMFQCTNIKNIFTKLYEKEFLTVLNNTTEMSPKIT